MSHEIFAWKINRSRSYARIQVRLCCALNVLDAKQALKAAVILSFEAPRWRTQLKELFYRAHSIMCINKYVNASRGELANNDEREI